MAREAYYYVTPPEPDWPPEKQEEWLTQFDYYALRDTSINEAWPGHYLNDLHFRNSPSKVTKIFSAYSFWEAWAHYCEQMMLEQGYRAGDDKLRLAQLGGERFADRLLGLRLDREPLDPGLRQSRPHRIRRDPPGNRKPDRCRRPRRSRFPPQR